MERVGRGTLHLKELVGEYVYLYVGRGKCGRTIDGRTNHDRTKDVVPRFFRHINMLKVIKSHTPQKFVLLNFDAIFFMCCKNEKLPVI